MRKQKKNNKADYNEEHGKETDFSKTNTKEKMKGNIDLISAAVGFLAAFLKGIKLRLKWKMMVISCVVGSILAFGIIGVLTYFLRGVSVNTIVLVTFAVGWTSNELTDIIERSVQDGYDVARAYVKTKKGVPESGGSKSPEKTELLEEEPKDI